VANKKVYKAEWARKWRSKPGNRERINAANKARLNANPEIRARYQATQRAKLGLPLPIHKQPLGCECCGRLRDKNNLNLDHCHLTGIFRGWLCRKCNVGIGLLGDSPDGVARAAEYLRRAYNHDLL
jgi:hypothetical protein